MPEGLVMAIRNPRRYRYSSWHTIYRALLDCFGRRRYHLGKELAGFHQQGEQVELRFADGTTRDDAGRPPSGVAALE